MKKILIVDDSPEIHLIARKSLPPESVGISAYTLAEAQHRCEQERFDLLILDVNLPDGSGFDFYRKIKETHRLQNISVIFLTGNSSQKDKIVGLSLGADDYIVKPFDPIELKLRVSNHLRRSNAEFDTSQSVVVGDLKFENHLLRVLHIQNLKSEVPLKLTPTGFKILSFLARSKDQIFSREEIIIGVWGEGFHITHRTVDSYIRDIRKELEPTQLKITSEYGSGYKLSLN